MRVSFRLFVLEPNSGGAAVLFVLFFPRAHNARTQASHSNRKHEYAYVDMNVLYVMLPFVHAFVQFNWVTSRFCVAFEQARELCPSQRERIG